LFPRLGGGVARKALQAALRHQQWLPIVIQHKHQLIKTVSHAVDTVIGLLSEFLHSLR
jgi:hypothetical protein